MGLFADADYVDLHVFAGKQHRFKRICQVVYIEHRHAFYLCYLIQVVVSRDNLPVKLTGKNDKGFVDLFPFKVLQCRLRDLYVQCPDFFAAQ